jgi:C4-dicarboxylate-specific signal transduction histidine kinase
MAGLSQTGKQDLKTGGSSRQAQAELAHVSRLTTMGELTASIAHEVNQPLTAVVNNANASISLLPKDTPGLEEVREALAEIIDDANRASDVIARVRQLAKRAPVEKTLLDLRDVVQDVLALARYESAARKVTIRTDLSKDLPSVSGDRVQLQQVLLNLVINGMDAMNQVEESKRVLITICGRRETNDGKFEARLSVRIQASGSNRRKWNGSSKHFTRRNRRGWEWGWRSAARSSRLMAAGCGLNRTKEPARLFYSACRLQAMLRS